MPSIATMNDDYTTWLEKKRREHHLSPPSLAALPVHRPALAQAIQAWHAIEAQHARGDEVAEAVANDTARALCKAWLVELKSPLTQEEHPVTAPYVEEPDTVYRTWHSATLDATIAITRTPQDSKPIWDDEPDVTPYTEEEVHLLEKLALATTLTDQASFLAKVRRIHDVKRTFEAVIMPMEQLPTLLPDAKEHAYER